MDGKQGKGIGRRAAIRILTAGALGWLGLPGLARAMGNQPKPDGIHQLNGDVRINDRPAKLGDIVRAGDVIRTGPKASVLFVAGGSVHLIRDNSRITFPPDDAAKDLSSSAIRAIKTVNGKILSVFGDGPHRIETALTGSRRPHPSPGSGEPGFTWRRNRIGPTSAPVTAPSILRPDRPRKRPSRSPPVTMKQANSSSAPMPRAPGSSPLR